MTKHKLLIVSDSATAPTGFGRVAEALADRWHASNKWTIKQMGINYFDTDHDKPYRIFSATGGGNFRDWIGYERIKQLYAEINPDVTFLFQDFWHVAEYIARIPEATSIVTYFPVDSPNVKPAWAVAQAAASEVCTYTNFAAEEFAKGMAAARDDIFQKGLLEGKDIIKQVAIQTSEGTLNVSASRVNELSDPANINVVPHGVDLTNFFPLDKIECRKELDLPVDKFIVGNVNRNQPRKRLDTMIRAFSLFAKDKKDAVLILHDPVKTPEGWDLRQLAHYYGVSDKVMISNSTYTLELLNKLYNSLDVMVNSSGGEGWGLTPFESAACGVPQIVPNWSATGEIWQGSGLLTDVLTVRHEAGKINTAQCVLDENHMAAQMEELYSNKKRAEEVGKACREVTLKDDYDWDNIAAKFEEILERSLENPRPTVKEISLR